MNALLTEHSRLSLVRSKAPLRQRFCRQRVSRILLGQRLWRQASLDRELPAGQTQLAAEMLAKDSDAPSLLAKLAWVTSALAA